MTPGQLTLDDITTEDDFDPTCGLTSAELLRCANWALEHRRADAWIRREGRLINESRAISWRLDLDPHLSANAREFRLDKGAYCGIDHRLSAPLARYYAIKYGLKFRLRARVGDHVKNATPECAL